VQQNAFVYRYTRQQFESEFGADYEKPGWFARFVAFLYRLVPKIGPLKPLSFKTPTPEAERLFAESFKDTRARFGTSLDAIGRGRFDLQNTDFDTGKPSVHGEYALADDTYAELLRRLAERHFTGVPRALQQNIVAFYAAAPDRTASRKERHRAKEIQENLAALKATAPR
jgi:hypothetical protein